MSSFSKYLTEQLNRLNQRKLNKGELFILAKSVVDNTPLPPEDTESVAIYMISQRPFINEVLYKINEYAYISNEGTEEFYRLVTELMLLRYTQAYKPTLRFTGDPTSIIADFSMACRFIDKSYFLAVGDMINDANYYSLAFSTLAEEIKKEIAKNKGEAS